MSLELQWYYGTTVSTIATTTTGLDGAYRFTGVPSLSSGDTYSVWYSGGARTPGRLWFWVTDRTTSYTAGSDVHAGDFDLADVALVSPANGATLFLPHTFYWTPRPATPSDIQGFYLEHGEGEWVADSGHQGSFTLESLPAGFEPWEICTWRVYVWGPDYKNMDCLLSGEGSASPIQA